MKAETFLEDARAINDEDIQDEIKKRANELKAQANYRSPELCRKACGKDVRYLR